MILRGRVVFHREGWSLDVTDRLGEDGLGTLSEELEITMTVLVHADMDFELDNRDGRVEHFLQGLGASDRVTVTVDRETGRRRPKWQRIFGGVLDLAAGSVRYDRKDKTVTVQAFSHSKDLERASAEPVRREITGRTGSCTSASASGTLSDTTDIKPGDEITINTTSVEERLTILTVDSATAVTWTAPASQTITSGAVTLVTPYYRNKTIEFLVGELFTAADFDSYSLSLDVDFARFPFASDINTDGLPAAAVLPRSIVDAANQIRATFASGTRRVSNGPQLGWTAGAASTDCEGDWRPYLTAEPGTIKTRASITDNGASAWDHTNGYEFRLFQNPNPLPSNDVLNVQRNGTNYFQTDSFGGDETGWDPSRLFVEYDPVNDRVWTSYRRADLSRQAVEARDNATTTQTDISTAFHGPLRFCRPLGVMLALEAGGTTLHVYDPASYAQLRTVTVPSGLKLWTLRAFDGFVAALFLDAGKSKVIVWDESWAEIVRYTVASTSEAPQLLTVFTDPTTGADVAVGYSSGAWFVLSRSFAGVLAYADFEGMSCAAALRDLALISGAYLRVDQYGSASIQGRGSVEGAPVAGDLPDPLDEDGLPVWEGYRASVVCAGKDATGADIEEIAGDSGDSAHRLEINSQLVTTGGVAQSVASLYAAILSTEREQLEVTVPEDGPLARPLQVWRLHGKRWLVTKAETDFRDREQDLELVEV